jgi:hypothetical protein
MLASKIDKSTVGHSAATIGHLSSPCNHLGRRKLGPKLAGSLPHTRKAEEGRSLFSIVCYASEARALWQFDNQHFQNETFLELAFHGAPR